MSERWDSLSNRLVMCLRKNTAPVGQMFALFACHWNARKSLFACASCEHFWGGGGEQ